MAQHGQVWLVNYIFDYICFLAQRSFYFVTIKAKGILHLPQDYKT